MCSAAGEKKVKAICGQIILSDLKYVNPGILFSMSNVSFTLQESVDYFTLEVVGL